MVFNGCAKGVAVSSVKVPNLIVTVGESPSTYMWSTITECGVASFKILESLTWLTCSNDTRISSAWVQVAPIYNTDAGTYILTLEMVLTSYSSAPAIKTSF